MNKATFLFKVALVVNFKIIKHNSNSFMILNNNTKINFLHSIILINSSSNNSNIQCRIQVEICGNKIIFLKI